MKKVILLILISLTWSVLASAQSKTKAENNPPKCTLGLDQAPELRGFRIGMTQDKVLARFPGTTLEKPDKFGLARLRISIIDSTALIKAAITREKGVQPDMNALPTEGSAFVIETSRFPAFKGVRKIQFRFIDGRLSYLQLAYDDSVNWDSIDQFIETISTTLKLPSQWEVPAEADGGGQEKELRCQAFAISASVAGDATDVHAGPELTLVDLAAWDSMSKRQSDIVEKGKRDEDEKRKAFKP
jgi:hypothetical protein